MKQASEFLGSSPSKETLVKYLTLNELNLLRFIKGRESNHPHNYD